jgi:hypothetical protein
VPRARIGDINTTLAALVALTILLAGHAVGRAGELSTTVGHCVVVYPVDVAGQPLTGTYEVCVPL